MLLCSLLFRRCSLLPAAACYCLLLLLTAAVTAAAACAGQSYTVQANHIEQQAPASTSKHQRAAGSSSKQ
ncbi:MAG: hypothetical protein ABSA11_13490 [Candidatus Bathyarchaeia archaeon]